MTDGRAATLLSRVPRRMAETRGKVFRRLAPTSVAPGCRLGARVVLDGLDRIRLDDKVILGDGVTIAARGNGTVNLGAKTFINAGSHLSSSEHGITLGIDVLVGPHVVVVDQGHAYTDPDKPVARQGMVGGGQVVIGDGSWLAAGAVVLGPTRLAPGSVVGANSVVRGDFPRRCVIVGAPGRVLRYLDDDSKEKRG